MSKSDWFANDPTLAWGFYSHRQHLYQSAEPHYGFSILHSLLSSPQIGKENYYIITSNVDSQFQKAGFPESNIFETHGSLSYQQCSKRCTKSNVWPDPSLLSGKPLDIDEETFRISDDKIPICSKCGAIARPNVSFFTDTDESFDNERQNAQKTKLLAWIDEIKKTDQHITILEIGCGTSIHSLRFETEILLYHTPEFNDRISLIRINPNDFEVEKDSKTQVGIGLTSLKAILKIAGV